VIDALKGGERRGGSLGKGVIFRMKKEMSDQCLGAYSKGRLELLDERILGERDGGEGPAFL